jgi:large subunit ribosomal protein L10
MPSQKKIETVANLKTKLEKTKAFFLTEYRGLTHQQIEQLKKALKKVGAEYIVAKNRLVKIALKQSNLSQAQSFDDTIKQLEEYLTNPTATLFAYEDEIAAIKELAKFIKSVQLPKIKIGFFAGKTATSDDFLRLSSLPDRNTLLALLVARLNSPVLKLHYALRWNLQKFVTAVNNIKEKKSKS